MSRPSLNERREPHVGLVDRGAMIQSSTGQYGSASPTPARGYAGHHAAFPCSTDGHWDWGRYRMGCTVTEGIVCACTVGVWYLGDVLCKAVEEGMSEETIRPSILIAVCP